MNISLGQIILVLFVCFLLFGNLSNTLNNVTSFIKKLKESLNDNEKK